MTNAEAKLRDAVDAMQAGKLSSYEKSFVEEIKDYDKKQLKTLSSKQYKLLEQCADKA